MNKIKTISIFFLMSITGSINAFVTVGLGPECDYNNLFDAYLSDDLDVRVTSEQVHTNNFTIEKFKFIKGGYDNCLTAEADIVGLEKSKWSGLNAPNNTVIDINIDLVIVATVIIENFEIYDGNNETASGAGGIKVSGNSNVIIRNSTIYDNNGNEGGGIHVFGEDATLSLENTEVRDNDASGYGGGIYCSNSAHLNIDAKSTINNNKAIINGGGLFAGFGCEINNMAGFPVGGRTYWGIERNEANKGGGIYLQTGAKLLVEGSSDHPARINGNTSFENNDISGSGIYLTGENTIAHLMNTHINNNLSSSHGAAMAVTDQASLIMSQATIGCEYGHLPCSQIKSNTAQSFASEGGAGYFSDAVHVSISQTDINDNRVPERTSVFVVNNSAYLRLEGNLISNNQASSNLDSTTSLILIGDEIGQAAQLDFIYNTVVNNQADNIFTVNNINGSHTLNVFNSIIWDTGEIFNFNGPALAEIDCSIVHESKSLSGNVGAVLTNDPLFINEAMADYRPSLASDAIDFCNDSVPPAQFNDLNNLTRGFDMLSVNNAFGVFDAGAYEYIPEIIFRNGFE
ncbi:MAG: hypothetical protein AB8B80_02470 [Marinicellaceae bacterium]